MAMPPSSTRMLRRSSRTCMQALTTAPHPPHRYADAPSILFAEGVSIAVKPPHGEWTRFEILSGGQQALVAVALTMALQEGTYLERRVEHEAGERAEMSEGSAAEWGSEGVGEADNPPPPFVLLDEIDAALDTHKVRALAEHPCLACMCSPRRSILTRCARSPSTCAHARPAKRSSSRIGRS